MLRDWNHVDLASICKQTLYTMDKFSDKDHDMIATRTILRTHTHSAILIHTHPYSPYSPILIHTYPYSHILTILTILIHTHPHSQYSPILTHTHPYLHILAILIHNHPW